MLPSVSGANLLAIREIIHQTVGESEAVVQQGGRGIIFLFF